MLHDLFKVCHDLFNSFNLRLSDFKYAQYNLSLLEVAEQDGVVPSVGILQRHLINDRACIDGVRKLKVRLLRSFVVAYHV